MEKTLTIDGKEVKFKVTGATATLYSMYFHERNEQGALKPRQMMRDLVRMAPIEKAMKMADDPEDLPLEAIEMIDFEVFSDIVWVFAKTANRDIPEKVDWLDEFDEFPAIHIFTELQPMLQKALAMNGQKKNPNHPALKNR